MSRKEYIKLKKKIVREERIRIFKTIILIILAVVLINCLSESNASAMEDDILKSNLTADTGIWTKDSWLQYNQEIQK